MRLRDRTGARFSSPTSRRHGADFSEIAKAVGTRTSTQVRTHVHKYHLKLVRECVGGGRGASNAALTPANSYNRSKLAAGAGGRAEAAGEEPAEEQVKKRARR